MTVVILSLVGLLAIIPSIIPVSHSCGAFHSRRMRSRVHKAQVRANVERRVSRKAAAQTCGRRKGGNVANVQHEGYVLVKARLD